MGFPFLRPRPVETIMAPLQHCTAAYEEPHNYEVSSHINLAAG